MAANTEALFSATIQDEAGNKANCQVHLFIDSAQSVANIDTALSAWLGDLDAITGGQIVSYHVLLRPVLVLTIKTAPAVGSEVQETATFDFTQTGSTYHYGNNVPAFNELKETADHKPNLSDTDVAAYTTLLTTAPVLGGYYSGLGNQALAALSYAFLPTRKHRRSQNRLSRAYPA